MKMLIKETEQEGLVSFLGKRILLMCAGYFYEGELIGVNDKCVKIKDPSIVYSTGKWSDNKYEDTQKLNSDYWYVSTNLIEAFGASKNG